MVNKSEKFPTRIILCGSGNSIPFNNEKGLDNKLKDVLYYEYSIGLNYWYKYGCNTTINSWVDHQWYENNLEEIKDLPLLIGKSDDKLKDIIHPNTYLIKPCRNNDLYPNKPWKDGFYGSHLVGMFALSLAINLGFKEIYLLGYDCKAINEKTHFYQDLLDPNEIGPNKKLYGVGQTKGNTERNNIYKNCVNLIRTALNRIKFNKDCSGCNTAKEQINMIKNSLENNIYNYRYNTGTYNNIERLNNYWFGKFKKELERVKIYNVSPESVLDVFPKITYNEFYEKLEYNPKPILPCKARMKIKELLKDRMGNEK